MKYNDFTNIMSEPRANRYLFACNGNQRNALTLYRKNLKLSQEFFTVISCFEIALRNRIDGYYLNLFGENWLQYCADESKIFNNHQCLSTRNIILNTINNLDENYSHNKLVAELGFGFWRYLFANNQFRKGGQGLLKIFSEKPKSNANLQYNHNFIFKRLATINNLRNRIAHHEPICFENNVSKIDTYNSREQYKSIILLFNWMNIDSVSLLYGLDKIEQICNEIDNLRI